MTENALYTRFTEQEVGIEYTMPIPVSDGSTKTTELLSVRGVGSAGRISL